MSDNKKAKRKSTKSTSSFRQLTLTDTTNNENEIKNINIFFGNKEKKTLFNKHFPDNRITTTKYNIITWAPKSLFIQFTRVANIYFLLISILTFMNFSPKNPISMISTFVVVLIFTMLKELYEDLKRYYSDKEINEKKALILNPELNDFVLNNWESILVGDIVKISKNESVPADILLLKSSIPSGICFIDTMNLDGETNLKEKLCVTLTKKYKEKNYANMEGYLTCDNPNEILEKWDCSLFLNDKPTVCSVKNLLLKGSMLKNTEYVEGIVIYTGHNTKIMKNANKPQIKVSNILHLMNILLASVFIFQFCICCSYSILHISWINIKSEKIKYIYKYNDNFNYEIKEANGLSFFLSFFTYLVAYSHLIPISLYVTLEIVKIVQSVLIANDIKMKDPELNKFAFAKTSDLIEELGQVEFIFSDKTGTLTRNEMIFRKCSIANIIYGETQETCIKKEHTINGDPRPYEILTSSKYIQERKYINDFFTVCSVCHSAYIEESEQKRNYQSSSPDEVALIITAANVGYEFIKRSTDSIEILNPNKEHEVWKLILELPFDSTRKRMSVIVKKADGIKDNNIYMFTKGADSAMIDFINETDENKEIIKQEHLKYFAIEGLRTLVFAKKILKPEMVSNIIKTYQEISISNTKNKEQNLSLLYEEIEKEMEYVGCSAIEDKLQEVHFLLKKGVPETIQSLINAKIRVWVLTGDKKETAIEIGKTCNLVLSETIMEGIDLASSSDKDDTLEELTKKFEKAYSENVLGNNKTPKEKKYIIIDGKNLAYVLNNLDLSLKFFELGLKANSVICCRVSPVQKALVVKLAKSNSKGITLAIGDGANDVPMIIQGHIGVGINGKEGTQAVRSGDYAISQFRFLKRLLFIHGRWGYRRISYFICYYFYKNIVLVFTELYFAFYNGFSGQIFFPDILPLFYNAFWTSWPCIFCYSLERDVDEEISLNYTILYRAGQINYLFNLKKFWTWILFAIIHGVITFYGCTYGLRYFLSFEPYTKDHWVFSTIAFTCLIQIVTYKIFIESMYWNWLSLIMTLLSLIFYYGCIMVFSIPTVSFFLQSSELYYRLYNILTFGKTWIIILFLPILAITPDIIYKFIQYNFFPTPSDILFKNSNYYIKEIDNLKKGYLNSEEDYSNFPIKDILNRKLVRMNCKNKTKITEFNNKLNQIIIKKKKKKNNKE